MRSLVLGIFLGACVSAIHAQDAATSIKYDPQIVSTLLNLLSAQSNTHPSTADFTGTSLQDLLATGTPEGYMLRTRYLDLGISLSQDLAVTNDKRLNDQLIEAARWESTPEIRAVALIAMAAKQDPQSRKYFEEALNNPKAEIRFTGLEALQIWGLPEAKDLYIKTINSDPAAVIRIYAAQALARLGDPLGAATLRKELDSGDWLASAMAARYLGDTGTGDDYDLVLDRMVREQTNNFVKAETAIAALKLFPKKTTSMRQDFHLEYAGKWLSVLRIYDLWSKPVYAQNSPPNLYIELAPLIITAPRMKVPATLLIDGRINNLLLNLLQTKANSRPSAADLQDTSVQLLNSLVSPAGYLLKMRYTELGFLLTEGLAGTADLILKNKIIDVANNGTNPQIRAAAMMAVSYSRDPGDHGIFQQALLDQSITVRFGAIEALLNWGLSDALNDIANTARSDSSGPLRMFSAQAMLRLGDAGGRDVLTRGMDDTDWVIRAMAVRYIGQLGTASDYDTILFNMGNEQNSFVQSEMIGALLRLAPLKRQASQ